MEPISSFLCHMVTTPGKKSICRLFSFNIKMSRSCLSFPKYLLGHGCVTQPFTLFSTGSMLYCVMGESCQTWENGTWLAHEVRGPVNSVFSVPNSQRRTRWWQGGFGYHTSADSLKAWQWIPMLGITAPDFLLSLTGTMIHQELPCEVHHDLIVLGVHEVHHDHDHAFVSWVALVTLYVGSLTWSRSCAKLRSKTHFCGHDKNNHSKQGQKQIKERQREIKKQERKRQSFPMFFFGFPSASKPLSSAEQSSDLLVFCLGFSCPLSQDWSQHSKRETCMPLRSCEAEHNEQTLPRSFPILLLPLYKKATGRSGTCSCSCAACRCVGALDSDMPSTPSKAREERKAECWGEKENLLFPLLLLSRVTASEDSPEEWPWLLPALMGKCCCSLSHHHKSMGKLSSWSIKTNSAQARMKKYTGQTEEQAGTVSDGCIPMFLKVCPRPTQIERDAEVVAARWDQSSFPVTTSTELGEHPLR